MRRVVLLLFLAGSAQAEEKTAFTGFIDAAFAWNRNHPSDHLNFIPGTGTSGERGDELALNLAQVPKH